MESQLCTVQRYKSFAQIYAPKSIIYDYYKWLPISFPAPKQDLSPILLTLTYIPIVFLKHQFVKDSWRLDPANSDPD